MVFDNNGERAPGAKAFFFDAGTSTPKTSYEDAAETTPNTHPVLADGNGRWPAVFLPYGAYKEQLTTSSGAAIGDVIDDIPNEAPTDPSDTVDPNALLVTGDVFFAFCDTTRSGAVRCNGRTLGNAVSGATERANADTLPLFTFLYNLSDTAAPVSGGRGANAAADFAAGKTIQLPSLRGTLPIGLTTMGNSDNGVLASTPVTFGSAILPGSQLGANTHALTTAELATHLHTVGITSANGTDHTHSVSITSSAGSAHSHGLVAATVTGGGEHTHTGTATSGGVDHNHAYTGSVANTTIGYTPGGSSDTSADDTAAGQITNNASAFLHTHPVDIPSGGSHSHDVGGNTDNEALHTHGVNGNTGNPTSHTHLVSGNTGNNGSGTAHNNVERVLTGTYFMKL